MHLDKKIFLLLTILNVIETNSNIKEKRLFAFVNGDFVIGVLHPIHHQPPNNNKRLRFASQEIKCGNIRESYGIQRVEVVFHTLDQINNDPNLLPNLTLGVEIRDDCWYAPVALQQSIELIRDAITPAVSQTNACLNLSGTILTNKTRGPLIGVVGPGSSSVALQVQNLLQLFHIPQVGYSTTSTDLSDKSRFNYFLRVVPSDNYQAKVMLDIVKYYNWTYVSVVNTDENYGQSGKQAFRKLAEEADVCIAREDSVLSNAPEEIFDKVILNLKQDQSAIVVVCFCEGFTVRGLLSATKRLNMTNHFLFIGSDGWADRGDVAEGLEKEAWGSISIRIHSPYVHTFDHYYWSLKPGTNLRNPWFNEFWESRFSCTLNLFDTAFNNNTVSNNTKVKRPCSGKENLRINYKQDSKLSFVIKAIYSLAHALHNMQRDICGRNSIGLCEKLLPLNGSLFKNYLMNVSFPYDNENFVEFDENGDPPGRYDIVNFQRINESFDKFDYVQVGEWHNDKLSWRNGVKLQFGPRDSIKSVCSSPCEQGHYKNVQKGGKDKRCCWVCVRCHDDEILNKSSESKSCQKCEPGFRPDKNQTECLKLPIKYVHWSDTEAIISMLFASIGLASTTFSFVIFVKYRDTPVVKSSTKELSFIILVGTATSHVSIFSIIAKPSKFTCTLVRFLPGLSFAMIYSALLTKTNRIARILAGSKKRFPTRKPRFMSATAQLLITSFLIGIEILISSWMLHLQVPEDTFKYHSYKTILECNTTPEGILIPLAFDFFLIILCTLYALKTRNVPENFNEAKFIGFAMYTTCVIWIAFIPIYFGSDSKVITMSMCVTLSAFVTWAFLFLPKLYIILLRPERNNRALFTTSKSIRCHIGSRVAMAIAEKTSTFNNSEDLKESNNCSGKRTLSCQTGWELIEVLLNPQLLVQNNKYNMSPIKSRIAPRIIERKCCQTDTCQLKKITIKLPDHP